jgi:hemolysin III
LLSIKLREPVNGLMHLGAAIAAGLGLVVLLIVGRDSIAKQASLLIYGAALILMFSASAAYHLVPAKPQATLVLRKLDHSAIYLLIAGTYTPICIHYFTGFWRWGVLAIIWFMASAGITVKLFVIRTPRWLTAAIYLAMGWMCLMGVKVMLATMPWGALAWLLLGGIFFSVGAIVYVAKRPNFFPGVFGFHEVWHIFVILGCLSHFILVTTYVAPPTVGA